MGHGYGLRCSPTVSVEDDAGALLFGEGQRAIVIYVEQLQDLVEGDLSVVVLEDLCVDSDGVVQTKTHGYLDFAVNGVGLLDATSEKPDHDGGWGDRGLRFHSREEVG